MGLRLSGYINGSELKKNVVYAVSGDMVRGSIIDSSTGVPTIEIMNYRPDVVSRKPRVRLAASTRSSRETGQPWIINAFIKQYHKD